MSDQLPQEKAPQTLLVVDDQQRVLASLRFLLEGANYRIIVADSCAAAVGAAEKEPIDGALLDVHMPVANGFETCQRLQAHAAAHGRSLRVWFMTGAPSAAVRRKSIELGAFGVFSKPFDYPEFLRLLDEGFSAPCPPVPPPVTATLSNESAGIHSLREESK